MSRSENLVPWNTPEFQGMSKDEVLKAMGLDPKKYEMVEEINLLAYRIVKRDSQR